MLLAARTRSFLVHPALRAITTATLASATLASATLASATPATATPVSLAATCADATPRSPTSRRSPSPPVNQCGACNVTYTPPPVETITLTQSCGCSVSLTFSFAGGQYLTRLTGPALTVGDWFTYKGVTYYVTWVSGNTFTVENASGVYLSSGYSSAPCLSTLDTFGYDGGLSFTNYRSFERGNYGGLRFGGPFRSRDFHRNH